MRWFFWIPIVFGILWIYSLIVTRKNKDTPASIPWGLLWVVSAVGFIVSTFIIECNWWWTIGLGLSSVILTVLAIYFWLAPNNIFFTLVNEGTAKIITTGGAAVNVLMQYKNYALDSNWNIVFTQGATQTSLFGIGGLRLYGIWPFRQVYTYDFSWVSVDQYGGKKEHVEEGLDYVLVKPTIYGVDLAKAETKYPERIPLNIQFLVTVRVINPYKVLFSAPSDWNEKLLARLNGFLRGWVANKEMDEILSLKGSSREMWSDLNSRNLHLSVDYFLKEWGVKLEENGIDMRDVSMSDEYQKAAASERIMELKSAGVASQTVGMIISAMAKSRGMKTQEIQQMINSDTQLQKEFMKTAKDLLERKMAIDGGVFTDIRVGGAEGLDKTLLQLLAAAKKISGGKS